MKGIAQQGFAPALAVSDIGKLCTVALIERLHTNVQRAALRAGLEPGHNKGRQIFHKFHEHIGGVKLLPVHNLRQQNCLGWRGAVDGVKIAIQLALAQHGQHFFVRRAGADKHGNFSLYITSAAAGCC